MLSTWYTKDRVFEGGINVKKKLLAIILSFVTLTATLSGCTKTSKQLSNSILSEDNGIEEITWMYWDNVETTTDIATIGYANVLDEFNERFAGKYHVTAIPTTLDEYRTKINSMISKGECPDVFAASPGAELNRFVEEGIAKDLTDILKTENNDWYESFTGGIFEKLTYNGRIMAIPTNFAAACVFYNTEIFEKADVKVPTTYEELIIACNRLKFAGYTRISISAGTAWCLSMLASYLCDREGGPNNLDKINAGTGSWLDPTFIRAGQKLVELSDYFQETAAGDTNEQATANFYNGEAAMLIQGSWIIPQINGANPDFESRCGVFEFPAINGGADPHRMIIKTDNFCISSQTKHEKAAIELMKMFTEEKAQRYMTEVAGKIPVINCEIDYTKAPKQLEYVNNIMKNMTATLGFYDESLIDTEAGAVFDNAMVSLFLREYTPEQAFQTIEDYYNANIWK